MAKRDIKTPNDYPLFGYRVLPEIKESLANQLEEVLKIKNGNRPPNTKPFKKNDVFIDAVERGLNVLKKREEKQGLG